MKFAIISADPSHGLNFWINPETGDATSFMNWLHIWNGFHFNYLKLRDNFSFLKDFDVVMMSGHPYHFNDIKTIADYLKNHKTVTMFYPEGSAQLYESSINNFHMEVYDAMNACDILSIVEEDKRAYYESFIHSETIVRFIHVPMRQEMMAGVFRIPRMHKHHNLTLVYGDNNPNHPLIAYACAKRLKMDVIAFESDRGKKDLLGKMFPELNMLFFEKAGQYPFLRNLGRVMLHFYPTEWIGTARQQISCAVTGTPCIGNHDSHTQRRLFPEIGFDIYDMDKMCEAADRLLRDERFYQGIVERAWQAVEFYDLPHTQARFVAAFEDALRIKNRVVVAT